MGHLVVTLSTVLEVAVISFEESEADARATFLGAYMEMSFCYQPSEILVLPTYFALGLLGSSQHGNVGRSATSREK
jgi:hypothetical protein